MIEEFEICMKKERDRDKRKIVGTQELKRERQFFPLFSLIVSYIPDPTPYSQKLSSTPINHLHSYIVILLLKGSFPIDPRPVPLRPHSSYASDDGPNA